MLNKKLFRPAVIITVFTLSVCGCGKQAEPVSAETTETVSEVDTEESVESSEDSEESMEPTPSPTATPTEKPVEESTENEIGTSAVEELPEEEDSEESTGIEIAEELDLQMYVQTSANARSGDSTEFEVVKTFSTNTQVHVTGKTINDWFRVEQSEGDVYVSGKLLGMEKVAVQQSSGGGSGQQPTGGGQSTESSSNVPQAGDVLGVDQYGHECIVTQPADTSGFY